MSFKEVHMAALTAALLAGTAGVAYAQSSSPSMAPAKHGASSTSMNAGAASQTGSAHSATTGAASDEMKKGETAKDSPKADSMKAESTKGEAAKAEKEGKSSATMGGNAKSAAETSPDHGKTSSATDAETKTDSKAAASSSDKANKADTTGKGADEAKSSSAKAGGNITLTTQQRTTIKKTVIDNKSAPRVTKVNFHISIGTVVPTTVHYAPLPETIVRIHPAWRGYDYIVYEDQVIVIEPHSHKIVEIIVVS